MCFPDKTVVSLEGLPVTPLGSKLRWAQEVSHSEGVGEAGIRGDVIRVTAFSRRKVKAAGSLRGLCTSQGWDLPLRGRALHFKRELPVEKS